LNKAETIFKRQIDVVFPYVPVLSLEERLLLQIQGRSKKHVLTLVDRYLELYSLIADFAEGLLRDYLRSIVAETMKVDIKGIFSRSGSSRETISFPIEDIYTPLKTIKNRIEPSTEIFQRTDYSEQRVLLTELLSEHHRLIVIGEPGGGKTTFLRLIACVLAKDALGQSEPVRMKYLGLSLDDETPIPIFIKIAGLAETMKRDSIKSGHRSSCRQVVETLEALYGHDQSKVLQKLLENGKCALLLDGLDEVSEDNMRSSIVEVMNAILQRWGNNLIIISSRPFGYQDVADLERMAIAHIDVFEEKEIIEFLNRWGRGLYSEREKGSSDEGYLSELKTAIIESPPIRRLARNPVMLTCLCVVHWNERKLPEGKADLLAAVLRWLLNAREEIRKSLGYTNTFAEECYKALALSMTLHPEGKQVVVDLSWAADQLGMPFSDIVGIVSKDRVRREGRRFLGEEMLNSGIIEKYGTGQARFWHLNFQEHYAARAMVDRSDDVWWNIIEPRLYDNQFAEVLDHLAGCLAWTGLFRLNLLVEKILGTAKQDDLISISRAVGVLGRILRILAVYDYLPPARLNWQNARDRVMKIFTVDGAVKVPVEQRIAVAEALGQAGDPRIKPLDPEMLPIPEMAHVLLGKYPVTVAEYRRFVENGAYEDPNFWGECWEITEKEGWTAPKGWDEQIEYLNRPVTGISWYEAAAYCNWLADQTGLPFRLQKNEEWEKAATHPTGGDYPWGAADPNPDLLNFDNNVRKPTPVGIYPAGAAYGGHLDMSGNIWEWVHDCYDKRGVNRVLRGGGWGGGDRGCRSAVRYFNPPGARPRTIGFRLSRSVTLGP
jgi:sulfatase-modifying factor enzyme 1/NACHT domain-containing protein